MANETCSRCASLEARISQLERENAALRRALARLRGLVRKALAILGALLFSLHLTRHEAELLLSQKSGVPRGKWSYFKGVHMLACPVIKQLEDGMSILREAL